MLKNKINILLLLLFISACADDNNVEETTEMTINENKGEITMSEDKVYTSMPDMKIDPTKSYTANINTSMGDMKVEFFSETAPVTVNNFISLASDGYYDNIIFHRVISGFMIQGGDPSGTGQVNTVNIQDIHLMTNLIISNHMKKVSWQWLIQVLTQMAVNSLLCMLTILCLISTPFLVKLLKVWILLTL